MAVKVSKKSQSLADLMYNDRKRRGKKTVMYICFRGTVEAAFCKSLSYCLVVQDREMDLRKLVDVNCDGRLEDLRMPMTDTL
jgi:hypothetical protein